MRLLCKIGAGAVQSYSHAEITGLVISDGAKIRLFSETCKFFLPFSAFFSQKRLNLYLFLKIFGNL